MELTILDAIVYILFGDIEPVIGLMLVGGEEERVYTGLVAAVGEIAL